MTDRPTDAVTRPERDERTGQAAAAARMAQKDRWVEEQIRVAMERGDFDDLPGAGKPIEGLGDSHDPDWWLKKLVEREKIAVLPLSVQLRKEDAELDDRLDTIGFEAEVRRVAHRLQRAGGRRPLPRARGSAAGHHAARRRRRRSRPGPSGAPPAGPPAPPSWPPPRPPLPRAAGGSAGADPAPTVEREIGHTAAWLSDC